MPGPEANDRVPLRGFFASVDLPKLLTVILLQRGLHAVPCPNKPDQLAFMPR